MKTWKHALAALGGVAAVIIISAFGATSAGTQPYKTDYMASWMQAIGSIAAIVASVALVRWQMNAERSRQELAEQKRIELRVEVVLRILAETHGWIGVIAANMKTDEDVRVNVWRVIDEHTIATLQTALDGIPLWDLPSSDFVTPIIQFKHSAARVFQSLHVIKAELSQNPIDSTTDFSQHEDVHAIRSLLPTLGRAFDRAKRYSRQFGVDPVLVTG
ncbi:hypothetical protein [Burkholderia seminalis]|uniref:hypothetical protein n=1 Tax=Burkholderia seminalis TaxID=488731 RepID=UPI001453D306|nr:hypothetical protein [Burkholderia seminalis]MCA8430073.1 hypothetical protein [Burkholderia seminalis]VWB16687.1 hypothetical protein BSE24067_00605 [Burkholderia seminalis]